MAGADDAGTGAIGADGLELTLRLGSPAAGPAPAPVGNTRNLTMIYGRRGVLCAVNVAERQARAIISMANREITGQVRDRDGGAPQAQLDLAMTTAPASPSLRDQAGLSMKRSLQRFLEKRKARVAAAGAPYVAHHRPAQLPGS